MGMGMDMEMEMERYEMGHCLAKKRSWSPLLVSVVGEKGLMPIRKGNQSVHLPSEVRVGMKWKWNGMEMEMESELERKRKTTTTNIQPTVRNGSIERKNPNQYK